MSNKATVWFTLIVVMILIVGGLVLLPKLPEQIPSHWNAQGQVDGYSGKWSAILLLPGIMLATIFLMLAIPAIDPLRANIAKFRPQFNTLIACMAIFFAYIHVLTLLAGLGVNVNMNRMMVPAMGLLFIFMGSLLRKAKRNYFIGIRTPWTLSSETVWDQTHRVGGIAFMIVGAICLLGILIPQYAFILLMVPVMIAALGSVVYSYILFRIEEKAVQ